MLDLSNLTHLGQNHRRLGDHETLSDRHARAELYHNRVCSNTGNILSAPSYMIDFVIQQVNVTLQISAPPYLILK